MRAPLASGDPATSVCVQDSRQMGRVAADLSAKNQTLRAFQFHSMTVFTN
jgi:hypothetical protein